MTVAAVETGFFGKVATHGDFVASRFDRVLRRTLDGWLQRSMAHSLQTLGDDWAEAFSAMPAWRFLLTPGLAGHHAFAGVMMPSADRVGRLFPLLVAARLPRNSALKGAVATAPDWFDAAETLLASTRERAFDLDRFDSAVEALLPELPAGGNADVESARSFWWTRAGRAGARRFSAAGLPAPEAFARFLGQPGARENGAGPMPAAVVAPSRRSVMSLASVRATHAGTRLRVNADAATDGARLDLHALAHGLGEPAMAAQAARLVIDRIARADAADTLGDLVAHAKGALGSANTLLRTGTPPDAPPHAACAVTLALQQDGFAVIWAGDQRCYLLRHGLMRCLTRDHVEIGLRRRLSRSIGGGAQLACDSVQDELLPGDRFLLAGASLAGVLADREIAVRLAGADFDGIAAALVEDALVAGITENVSAVVVEARQAGGATS